jgi:2-methylisocitrate lyase-like PEP mutase family enzyme
MVFSMRSLPEQHLFYPQFTRLMQENQCSASGPVMTECHYSGVPSRGRFAAPPGLSMPNLSTSDKRKTFRALHQSGCFVIPNPWSVGTARYLQGLGFKALASTSSGYAHSQGHTDGDITRDQVLAHFREIANAVDVPMNGDFEGGFAHEPGAVAENVRLCVETGVAGLSIEDFTGDETNPLYDFDLALERVRAARAAIDKAGGDVLFTARTEGFIHGRPDLDETIRRLKAFADAGADCLYSPGIKTREQLAATAKAVAPKPINFLNSGAFGLTVKDLAELGVRRISVGGTLARVAMHAFVKSATEIARDGKFDSFANIMPNAELNKFFSSDGKK